MVIMDDLPKATILLVRVGAMTKFIYCIVRLAAAEEQAAQYKKRAHNTVIFYVIMESIWQIKDLTLYYYSREMRVDEDLKLYIPPGVKPEAELFTGFEKRQLFQALIGPLVMGGAAALVWLLTVSVTTTIALALIGIFGSVITTTKDQSNSSVIDQVQNLVRFLSGQKIYPYRYRGERGLE